MPKMGIYYNRKGEPVGEDEGRKLWEADRTIGKTILPSGILISTVFIPIAMNFMGPPELFETMVFPDPEGAPGRDDPVYTQRYTSEEAAVRGHTDTIYLVFMRSMNANI